MKKYNRSHIGEIWRTNEGYDCEIIDGGSKHGYNTIKINEYIVEKTYQQIYKGNVKYPFHPSVYNIGYFGVGKYLATKNKKRTKVYDVWQSMIQRCYDEIYQKMQPTYIGTTVCNEWLNFQVFARWFYKHYIEGYAIDKDLLSEPNAKTYSPITCIFIPQALNSFLTNKQKTNTSGYIGINYEKDRKKWKAEISNKKGKTINLGRFDKPEDAAKAYSDKRKEFAKEWKIKMKGILPDEAIKNIV